MPRTSTILATTILLLMCTTASAEMYRYEDDQGSLHFVESLAEVPKKFRKAATVAGEEGNVSYAEPDRVPPPSTRSGKASQAARPRTEAKVEVFLTSWCGYCKKTVSFLNQKGIEYTAYDIEKDSHAHRIYKSLGGRGVPVVRVGEKVIYGYNPDAILSHLGKGR